MSTSESKASDKDEALLKRLKEYLQSPELRQCVDPSQYLVRWFNSTELIAAHKNKSGRGNKLVFRFPVLKEYLQGFSTYAGGAQAAVHDTCTGWALWTVAKPGYWASLGSTRTLNMSYFKSAQEGDIVRIEVEIVSIGSRMAMIRGTLFREKDGQIVSTSEHHLHNNDTPDAKL